MDLVWYASYGSNMDADRFGCYLSGGQPAGASRTYPGCRDTSPPRGDRPIVLDGLVYFAWESPTWGGGIAFYDPLAPGESVGRAYLITTEQLVDVATQEMHREPGADLDLTDVLADGRAEVGPGRYETLHVVGEIDGISVITFTSPWAIDEVDLQPPAAAYVRTISSGLRDAHGWGDAEVLDYLLERPGIKGHWDPDTMADLVAQHVEE